MAKIKYIIMRIGVFLLVFFSIVVVIVYFTSYASPFYVFHDAGAYVKVWLDPNGNGKQEFNEPFLPNICVWGGYTYEFQSLGGWEDICSRQYFLTDSGGEWSNFFAGGTCIDIYIAINPPENYYPTTPTIVNGCDAEFGLSQEKPLSEIISQDAGVYLEQQNQREKTIHALKIGIIVLIDSIIAGFASFKIIRPSETEED